MDIIITIGFILLGLGFIFIATSIIGAINYKKPSTGVIDILASTLFLYSSLEYYVEKDHIKRIQKNIKIGATSGTIGFIMVVLGLYVFR